MSGYCSDTSLLWDGFVLVKAQNTFHLHLGSWLLGSVKAMPVLCGTYMYDTYLLQANAPVNYGGNWLKPTR